MSNKFNKEICEDIIVSYENGLPLKSVAAIVGISYKTLKSWLKKGEKEESGVYHEFFIKMEEAKAKFIAYHLGRLNNSDKDTTHKWLLEITDPEHFGKKEQVEHFGEIKTVNTNIEIDKDLLDTIIDDKKENLGNITDE